MSTFSCLPLIQVKPPKPEQPFRFLDLPGELRNCVYHHALVSPKTFTVRILFAQTDSQTDTALLRVNKQIHDEALAIFYSGNTFCFPQHLFIGNPIMTQLEKAYRVSTAKLEMMRKFIFKIPVGIYVAWPITEQTPFNLYSGIL